MFVKKMSDKPDAMKFFCPLIFPDHLVHEDVANAFLMHEVNKGFTVHSAGEITLGFDLSCNGKSDTLRVKSDPEDTRRVQMANYGGLYE